MDTKLFRLFCATIAGSALLNSIELPAPVGTAMRWDQAVYAKSSGGRSSGGSFSRSRSSSSSRSGSSSSSGSSSGGSSWSGGSNSGGSTVIVPGGGGYYGGSSSGGGGAVVAGILLIVALLIVGGAGFLIWYLIKMGKPAKGLQELDNDIVTVTKVQVALLAQGKAIQSTLATVVQEADTETPEGLQAELQEAVLALLRMPENWSHVLASSETVKSREEAQKIFSQRSIAERSKFSEETLTNVSGTLKQKAFTLDEDKEPASFIVVTLLVGTADDRPLFGEVRTTEGLKEVLEKLASLNPDYLLTFELLWTPQAEGDSLTYDEMLTEYPEMLQI